MLICLDSPIVLCLDALRDWFSICCDCLFISLMGVSSLSRCAWGELLVFEIRVREIECVRRIPRCIGLDCLSRSEDNDVCLS